MVARWCRLESPSATTRARAEGMGDPARSGSGAVVVVASRDFDVASKHCGQQLVKARGDIPRKPVLATRWTFLHRNVEDDSNAAVALGGLGPSHGDSGSLVAAFASHQRLLR
jgi:hypothetical protein